jgi:hypothetical protein
VLLIEAELRTSEIHGVGLFCVLPVPKGTKVWQFHPQFDVQFDDSDMPALPPPIYAFLRKYAYRSRETKQFILSIDLSRHMNHSDSPTLYSDADSSYYTAFDFAPGTELTCDYREFSTEGCSDFLDQQEAAAEWASATDRRQRLKSVV